MMKMEGLESQVKEIISKVTEVPLEKITPDADLFY